MISRALGLLVLLSCALLYTPEATNPRVLGALVVPSLAAIGLWLVLPNPVLLSGSVCAIAITQTSIGSPDFYSGTLYPLVVLVAGASLIQLLWRRRDTTPSPDKEPPSDP